MKSNLLVLLCLINIGLVNSQTKKKGLTIKEFSLNQAINIAKENSIDYMNAKNSAEVSYWNFESFEASFYPSLNLNGVLPNYQRSINRITADDGSDIFISQNQAFSSLSLNIQQNFPLTGGLISVSSSLNRIDLFSSKLTNYSSVPLSISYFQESIFYNPFKWRKQIEPLNFEESKRQLLEDLQKIGVQTVEIFFDHVLAETKYNTAIANQNEQSINYKISKGRFEIGKLFESDVLQAELSLLNADKEVVVSKNELTLTKQAFLQYLGISKEIGLALIIPEEIVFTKIDSTQLFNRALQNKKLIIAQKRKILEAQQEVAKIKSDGIKIGVRGNFGLTQQDNSFSNVYVNPFVQQNFSLTVEAPLFTWGRRKADKKIAVANLDLVESQNQLELTSAIRELKLRYIEWKQIELSIKIQKKAADIAIKRYNVTNRRFKIAKVSITDLNIAQNEKDIAIYNYYEGLKDYWLLYYELRKLALYDFVENKNISLND